jgi:signal transduction histidine kinase/DNA-binding response OmpR family regulator
MSNPLRVDDKQRAAAGASLLAGPTAKARAIADSDMAAAISGHDWAATPLGPADQWPQSLKSTVRLILGSRYPMFIWWGPELVCIYNDAYADILGARHPFALGRSGKETWGDIWSVIGPQVDAVTGRGESTWNDRVLLVMERKGFTEETYFTFSYSPCFDDEGHVGGVLSVCTEDTARVLGDRRLQSLRQLADATADSATPQQACDRAASALQANEHDLPFVAIWLPEGEQLRLSACTDGVRGTPLAPALLTLADAEPWPVADAITSRDGWLVQDVDRRFLLDAGPWPEPVREALVLPLPAQTPGAPAGLLVAGLNPRRPLDADYRDYLALVVQQVATAIADARGVEEEQRRIRALAELDAAKTTFFSNISHELRTPLALMLAPLEDLLSDGRLSADATRTLLLAQRNGKRLQRLVDALLDFSRIEAGRMQARFQPTDLARLTAELASFFDSAARRGGLAFEIDCAPLPQPVYVDRLMWEKIVFNLVANALKYTPAGRVSVRLTSAGDVARLEVSDTGTGIAPEALPRVFERFFRAEAAQGRSVEGTGIGLALVAELARLHDATASVQSEPGRGSTFRIDIPFGKAHLDASSVHESTADESADPSHAVGWLDEVDGWLMSSAPEHDEPAPEPEGDTTATALLEPSPQREGSPRGSILLVDDNADMRSYLSRLLGREHEVRTASDGWQALRRIAERMPDLVLTDVMMGGMDGFQLLERLRDHEATATLPVVMLSAHAGDESRLRALEAGADDFLVKPFQARELVARVSGTLRLAQVRREAMRREQELRAEVEQVLESIAEGFIAVDADWKFTYVNAAAEKIYGRSREAVLGRSIWEAFPELCGSAFEEPFRRAMRDRTPMTVEGPYDPLSGWFDVGVYPVASGGLSFYFRDVLQNRLMERSIRDSEEQQRFLSEFGLLMQRTQDPHEVLNAAVRAIAEHVGADRCMWALVDEEQRVAHVQGEFRRAGMASRLGTLQLDDYNLEQMRLHRQGRPFIVHDALQDERLERHRDQYRLAQIGAAVTAGVLRGDRIVAAIALHQRTPRQWNETEISLVQAVAARCWEAFERAQVQQRQRQDAEALAQAHAALQQVERRKDQFIATLAHELRNPLAPLRNGVQLLALGGGPDGGARVQAMMRRQIDHLVRLVDDLLEVSRITSGKVVLQKGRVELSELLHGAADSSRPVVETARHSLHVDVDALAGVHTDGDAMRLGQVFTNLLNNAAKYTEPGGHIAVRAWREGDQAVVQVQDNGLGLAKDMLEEVFQPFVQVDRSASRAQGGLGIGLSIVRSLVELHGGSVRAMSDGPNRGSTFEVRLPVLASAVQPAGPARPELVLERPPAAGPSVLVVDDNRDAADSLGYMLEMMGASVRVVYGGPDAVAAVEAEAPALVLLDIGMPGMDGYQVARKLAAHPERHAMQIVALTGWGQAEDRQRTREAGFDEHLVKPAELDALEALLQKVAASA